LTYKKRYAVTINKGNIGVTMRIVERTIPHRVSTSKLLHSSIVGVDPRIFQSAVIKITFPVFFNNNGTASLNLG
jgi:hypothetical protein